MISRAENLFSLVFGFLSSLKLREAKQVDDPTGSSSANST